MDIIEKAMLRGMTSKECYQKPKQEQEKPNTISRGVSAILETINKKDRKHQTDNTRTDHFDND